METLLSLSIAVAASLVAVGLMLGRRGLLSALGLYSILVSLDFILRPLLLHSGLATFGVARFISAFPVDVGVRVLLFFVVWYCATIVGYILPRRPLATGGSLWRVGLQDCVKPNRLGALIVLLTAIVAWQWTRYLGEAGSLSALLVYARLDLFETNVWRKDLPVFLLLISLFSYMQHRSLEVSENGWNDRFALAGIAISAFVILTCGERGALLLPVLVLILAYKARGFLSERRIIVVGAAFVGVLVVLQILRITLTSGAMSPSAGAGDVITRALNANTYDNFVFLVDLGFEPGDRGGQDFLNGLVGVVPRSLWEDKPSAITPGAWLRQLIAPNDRGGRPFTNVGVWWVNFGYLGLLLGGLATGAILKYVDMAYDRSETNTQSYVVSIAFVFLFLSGLHSLVLIQLVRFVVPVCVAILWTNGWFGWRQEPC